MAYTAFATIAIAALTVSLTAASPQQSSEPSPSKSSKSAVTLSGCISRDAKLPGSFTLNDLTTGTVYRLSGVSMRKYAGQRVELVGGPPPRLTFRGGLVPSPNVAAQAGAMDPAKAAIATMPGGSESATGDVRLPEFRVSRVRTVNGSCQ